MVLRFGSFKTEKKWNTRCDKSFYVLSHLQFQNDFKLTSEMGMNLSDYVYIIATLGGVFYKLYPCPHIISIIALLWK